MTSLEEKKRKSLDASKLHSRRKQWELHIDFGCHKNCKLVNNIGPRCGCYSNVGFIWSRQHENKSKENTTKHFSLLLAGFRGQWCTLRVQLTLGHPYRAQSRVCLTSVSAQYHGKVGKGVHYTHKRFRIFDWNLWKMQFMLQWYYIKQFIERKDGYATTKKMSMSP